MKFKFFILISLFFSLHTQATLSINDSNSKLNFYPESNEINANSENILTIEISMDKGWHTYWINPGDSGDPAEFQWELPCLLYTSPSPRDLSTSRMPSSA